MLETNIEEDQHYVADRAYAKFTLFNIIVLAKSSYICRLRDRSVWDTVEDYYRNDNASLNEIIRNEEVCFPSGTANNRTDHTIRVICIRINPHTIRCRTGSGRSGGNSDGIL